MKIKNCIYILLACYAASFLRISINNNFIVSIIGSFLLGFVKAKRLSSTKEKIMLSGFFSCFTSFSGFIYFLYQIFHQGDFMKFIFWSSSVWHGPVRSRLVQLSPARSSQGVWRSFSFVAALLVYFIGFSKFLQGF